MLTSSHLTIETQELSKMPIVIELTKRTKVTDVIVWTLELTMDWIRLAHNNGVAYIFNH